MKLSKRKAAGSVSLLLLSALLASPAHGQGNKGDENYRLAADTSAAARNIAISPDLLLKGRVSGVRVSLTDGNPAGAILTQVRGANSLRGNSDPLWIVDGVILNPSQLEASPLFWKHTDDDYTATQNTLATINPNDIESIEVLKNVSATAIYGANGANGVVIIRTKQAAAEQLKISWQSNVTMSTAVKNGDDMLGLPAYRDLQQRLGNDVSALDGNADWYDKALQNAFSHNHNLSVSGAERRIRYYVGGNIRQLNSVVTGNDSWLGGFRVNFDMEASRILSFGVRLGISYAGLNATKGTNALGRDSWMSLITTAPPALNAPFSPRTWENDFDDFSEEYRILPTAYFTLRFMPELKLDTSFGLDFRSKDRSVWLGNGTSFGLGNNGALSLGSLSAFHYNAKSVLSYDTVFGMKHNFAAGAGVEVSGYRHISDVMFGLGFDTHALRAKGIRGAKSKSLPHKYDTQYDQFAVLANVGYDYDGMAGVNVTARADKARKYDGDFEFYPSASGFWDVRKTFFDGFTPVSKLSLRGGWGKAAREYAAPYEAYTSYYTGKVPQIADAAVFPFFDTFIRNVSEEFNVGMDMGFWDNRITVSVGYYEKETTDKFRIYQFGEKNKGDDAKYWRKSSRRTWHKDETVFTNKGFEVDLAAKFIKTEDWSWDVGFNIATNRNKITSPGEGDMFGQTIGLGTFGIVNANKKGWPVGSQFGFKHKGFVTQQDIAGAPAFYGVAASAGDMLYQDRTGDDDITNADRVIIGNPHPKVYGGFSTRVSYKRFALEMSVDFAGGHDVLNLDRMMRENVNGINNITKKAYMKGIREAGQGHSAPWFESPSNAAPSNYYIEKGDYARMSNITLSYKAPVEKIKWIKSLELYFNVNNAFVITSYDGWNPEVNCYGVDNARQGIAYGGFPDIRSFTLGINATF